MTYAQEIRSRYFKAQRKLVEAKQLDDRSVLLSFPLHYSGYTRVEFSVTRMDESNYLLSDFGQTFGELHDSGYRVVPSLKQRILEITKIWRVSLAGECIVRTCLDKELGTAIHEFAEALKTIGDAYLAYPRTGERDIEEEDEVKQKIRLTLNKRHLRYKEGRTILGKIGEHKLDFYVSPNGQPGLALAIQLSPDRVHAEAWEFKANDIKRSVPPNKGIVVGVVYDPSATKNFSRKIIDSVVDISLPSTEIDSFDQKLDAHGVKAVVQ
ncbi:MAG: hypothetical protein AABN33_13520 [Acidobacteriota bacterium]